MFYKEQTMVFPHLSWPECFQNFLAILGFIIYNIVEDEMRKISEIKFSTKLCVIAM